jgi:transketolase
VAWAAAVERANGPSALIFSRQNCPFVARTGTAKEIEASIRKGAYVLREAAGGLKKTRAVIIATGSEIGLALGAQEALAALGIGVRVVSMPSTSLFDKQSAAYKSSVLPAGLPRIAVEMGVTDFWWKYGCAAVVGIDTFGESAPAPVLFKHFGFTVENVVRTVRDAIA